MTGWALPTYMAVSEAGMDSVEQCRMKAETCVEQAQSANEPERAALLKVAQEWRALAEQFAALPTTEPKRP